MNSTHNKKKGVSIVEIERMLEDIEANNGIIVGGDFNTTTNKQWDQKEYTGEHSRTKATQKLIEWETTKKLNDIFRLKNPKKNEATYMPDTEQNR